MLDRNRPRFRRRRFSGTSLIERLLILAVVAIVGGVSAGLVLPKVSPTIGKATGEYTATGPAADVLSGLKVDDHPDRSGYDRDMFGYRQTDDDGDGCDVREAVMARDLKNVTYKYPGSCKVATGTLDDPYTGQTINFVRGPQTSAAVQIDHVVALENAWQSGARDWTTSERYRFGNDMANLLAVDGPANQDKGSASAAYWLPTNGAYRCEYVARQIGIKDKYDLTVTTSERDAMRAVLRSCPAQEIPVS